MIGSIKAEIYKMLHNYFLYSCGVIIVIMYFLCNTLISDATRFDAKLDYFFYAFLLVINLLVGSTIAGEYGGNMKENILSVRNRIYVIGAKIIVIIITVTALFGIYLLGMFQFGMLQEGTLPVGVLVTNQYVGVLQHTFILILCSILIKSFSGLTVGTVIFLCIYKEMGKGNIYGYGGRILEGTFYNQFTGIMETKVTIFSLVIIIASLFVTFLLFSRQEIS